MARKKISPKSVNDFEREVIYRITRGNHEFKVGDHIWFGDERTGLNCIEAHGWLEYDELDESIMDFDAEIDPEWELEVSQPNWTDLKSYKVRKKEPQKTKKASLKRQKTN